MSRQNSILRGFTFGIVASCPLVFLFIVVGQILAGGFTSFWGETWLYLAVCIPFGITFAFLGSHFYKKERLSAKTLWIISLISSFFIAVYSATVGTVFGESIVRGGFDTLNITGIFSWGIIYALVLTPIVTLVVRVLIGIFLKRILKINHANK